MTIAYYAVHNHVIVSVRFLFYYIHVLVHILYLKCRPSTPQIRSVLSTQCRHANTQFLRFPHSAWWKHLTVQ